MRFSPFKVSVAIAVTTVTTLGGALAASAAVNITPRPAPGAACVTPAAPAGTTITVNAHGDASAPAQPGRLDYRCTGGAWVRIRIPARRPQHPLPGWVHWTWASKAARADCHGGPAIIVWPGDSDQSVLVCKKNSVIWPS